MFKWKLLALALSLALPDIVHASRFRADDPTGFPLFESAPEAAVAAAEERPIVADCTPLPIFYKDGTRMISQGDMENLKLFAANNAGKMFIVSVFYADDRALGLERLRGIKKALVASGADNANIMLMPIKDIAKNGTAELKVLAE